VKARLGNRLAAPFSLQGLDQGVSAQAMVVGNHAPRRLAERPIKLRLVDVGHKRDDDLACHLVLNREDTAVITVIIFRPEMNTGACR
jgi:hypothetical protein